MTPWQEPTLVIVDPGIDPNKLLFDGIDTSEYPHFSVGEVGKYFFAKSPAWVRSMERDGKLQIEGEPIFVPRRRIAKNARFFCLEDVEKMAHALAYHRAISGMKLRVTLTILREQGKLWGYLDL